MRADPGAGSPTSVRRRLPFAAFVFVVGALIALALTPALVLERVSLVSRELSTTLLPIYDSLREVALAMEQQSSAVRGFLLSGDARYHAQLEAAQADELEAFQQLEPLLRRIGRAPIEHFDELRELSNRRYSQNAALMEAEAGFEAYRDGCRNSSWCATRCSSTSRRSSTSSSG